MRAMILAAGRGERMRPFTDVTPKPLLVAGGRALIEYHLTALAKAGIREVVINHSWLGDKLMQRLGNGERYQLAITYSAEPGQALETAGGIKKALPLLGDEPFIVVNGDIWTDFDFSVLPATQKKLAHLVLVPNPEHHPQGDFDLDDHGLVCNEPRYTFSGISVFSPEFFHGLTDGVQPLAPLLRQAIDRQEISGELYTGQWWDVGTPLRLTALDQYLLQENPGKQDG